LQVPSRHARPLFSSLALPCSNRRSLLVLNLPPAPAALKSHDGASHAPPDGSPRAPLAEAPARSPRGSARGGARGVRMVGWGRRRRGDTTCGRVCGACCKCVSHMFQISHEDVARVSCGCCKSRSRCFSIVDVDPPTQRLILAVATIYFRMLQMLQLLLTYFCCCKH
jgi:hypothetical protein